MSNGIHTLAHAIRGPNSFYPSIVPISNVPVLGSQCDFSPLYFHKSTNHFRSAMENENKLFKQSYAKPCCCILINKQLILYSLLQVAQIKLVKAGLQTSDLRIYREIWDENTGELIKYGEILFLVCIWYSSTPESSEVTVHRVKCPI